MMLQALRLGRFQRLGDTVRNLLGLDEPKSGSTYC